MFWIFAIVAVVVASRLLRTRMMTQMRSGRSREDDQLIGSMHSEIGQLTDRVKVLERLVTDEDRNLSREINNLRERPAARL